MASRSEARSNRPQGIGCRAPDSLRPSRGGDGRGGRGGSDAHDAGPLRWHDGRRLQRQPPAWSAAVAWNRSGRCAQTSEHEFARQRGAGRAHESNVARCATETHPAGSSSTPPSARAATAANSVARPPSGKGTSALHTGPRRQSWKSETAEPAERGSSPRLSPHPGSPPRAPSPPPPLPPSLFGSLAPANARTPSRPRPRSISPPLTFL